MMYGLCVERCEWCGLCENCGFCVAFAYLKINTSCVNGYVCGVLTGVKYFVYLF